MKKSYFTNAVFYWASILLLSVLLLWNLYLTIAQSRLVGLLPIVIQTTLLVLIFRKHEYAKNGLKYWAIIFLIVGPGLQFFGRFLENLTSSFSSADLAHYLTTGITILIGIVIVVYTNRTVEILQTVEEEAEPNNI